MILQPAPPGRHPHGDPFVGWFALHAFRRFNHEANLRAAAELRDTAEGTLTITESDFWAAAKSAFRYPSLP